MILPLYWRSSAGLSIKIPTGQWEFYIPKIEHCSLKKEETHESKAKHPAASGLSGVERGGIQYPTHRPDGLPSLPLGAEFFAVCAGFCRVSAVYLWKTGEKAHQPDCLLFRGATLFPEIL